MPKSRGRRAKRKIQQAPKKQQPPQVQAVRQVTTSQTVMQSPEVPKKSKPPRSVTRTITEWTLGIATVLGAAIAAVTLLPRLTVYASGDFSNPASIAFVVTNTNFVPLRKPGFALVVCDVLYDDDKATEPPVPCGEDASRRITQRYAPKDLDWLSMDGKYTLRLEDFIASKVPIKRANVSIWVEFYPWYLPWRLHRSFGFRTTEGADGNLYWRVYTPE